MTVKYYLLKLNTVGSTIGIPIKVNKSHNIELLIRESSAESIPNEGDKLTSSSQGFNLSSTKMSNPYNSIKFNVVLLKNYNSIIFKINRLTI